MLLVVTGSSTGIGRALVERLLLRGDTVWGLARSDQADFAAQHAGRFHPISCDVSNWEQVQCAAQKITALTSSLDGVVTCAGIQGEVGRTFVTDPTRWSATVRANLDGTYFTLRAMAPLLARTSHRTKIVCFSGGGATKSRAHFSAYGAAKTAIVRLVETIAEEECESLLDINAVAPGAINTRLTDEVLGLGPSVAGPIEYVAAQKQKLDGGQSLEKALDCIEWLLSSSSDGISGKLISAQWDPWPHLHTLREHLKNDIYTLRRILPEDRGQDWNRAFQ